MAIIKAGVLLLALLALFCCATAQHELIVALQSDHTVLERTLHQISDPSHSTYGRWLSVEDIAALVRSPQAQQVLRAVQEAGAEECHVVPTGDYVRCAKALHLSAASRRALSSRLSSCQLFFRPPSSGSAPSGASLSAVRRRYWLRRARSATRESGTPGAQRAAYGIPAQQAITNKTNVNLVWGPGTYGYLESDLSSYYQTFGINQPTSNVKTVGFPGVPGGDNFGECSLDVQCFTGIGQGALLDVSNTNTTMSTEEGDGFGYAMLDWSVSISSSPKAAPRVVSLSLGSLTFQSCTILCESAVKRGIGAQECHDYLQRQRQICMFDSNSQIKAIDINLMKLTSRGTTIVAAAGDGGSHFSFVFFPKDRIGSVLNEVSCAHGSMPTYPSSSPYVLGIGGTQWSSGSKNPVAWNSGGSGYSWILPRPAYQQVQVDAYLTVNKGSIGFPVLSSFNSTGRAYPDVSALADNVPVVMQGRMVGAGGTSASAPEVGGFIALINDLRLNKNLPPLGFLNPRLYKAAAQSADTMFYDVIIGNSKCAINGCCDTGFPCTAGWDSMTGFGSPRWAGWVQEFGTDNQYA